MSTWLEDFLRVGCYAKLSPVARGRNQMGNHLTLKNPSFSNSGVRLALWKLTSPPPPPSTIIACALFEAISVYRKERGILTTHISVQEFFRPSFCLRLKLPRNRKFDKWLFFWHRIISGIAGWVIFKAPWQIFHTRQGYYRSYTGSNSRLARLALMAVARTSEGKTFLSTNAPSNRGPNIGT